MNISSLLLNSNQRQQGTLSNPSFVLRDSINDVVGIKIKSAMIPLSNRNIEASRNNMLYTLNSAGTVQSCSLSSGNYSSSNIATFVKNALNTISLGYNCTYNTLSNQLTISNTSGVYTLTTGNNSINPELGITSADMVSTTQGTLSNVIDLAGVKTINIASNLASMSVHNQPINLLASIPMFGQVSSICYYKDQSNDYIRIPRQNLNTINLQLYDELFRRINPLDDYSINLNFLKSEF